MGPEELCCGCAATVCGAAVCRVNTPPSLSTLLQLKAPPSLQSGEPMGHPSATSYCRREEVFTRQVLRSVCVYHCMWYYCMFFALTKGRA